MPSGKTHDYITILLTTPILASAWQVSGSVSLALIVTVSFVFGGLMFGPDLDTKSKQYSRWLIFSFLWFPYKFIFKHRSRWSHGLIFGPLIRTVYFFGVLTLLSFIISLFITICIGSQVPGLLEFTKSWQQIGGLVRRQFGDYAFPAAFVGTWLGAASHTFADMAGTYIKTGRIG